MFHWRKKKTTSPRQRAKSHIRSFWMQTAERLPSSLSGNHTLTRPILLPYLFCDRLITIFQYNSHSELNFFPQCFQEDSTWRKMLQTDHSVCRQCCSRTVLYFLCHYVNYGFLCGHIHTIASAPGLARRTMPFLTFKTGEVLNAMKTGFTVIWWLKLNGKIHHFIFRIRHLPSVTIMDRKYKPTHPVFNRK